MATLEKIDAGNVYDLTGYTIVFGDVGDGATLTVAAGNITIYGDVGKDVTITLCDKPQSHQSSEELSAAEASANAPSFTITIFGEVGDSSKIESLCHATINVLGPIGDQCNISTIKGDIQVGKTAETAKLSAPDGEIFVDGLKKGSPPSHSGAAASGEGGSAPTYTPAATAATLKSKLQAAIDALTAAKQSFDETIAGAKAAQARGATVMPPAAQSSYDKTIAVTRKAQADLATAANILKKMKG